jgi:predicted phage terminase large subunit-like protein
MPTPSPAKKAEAVLTALTSADLAAIEATLPHLSPAEKLALLEDLEAREERVRLRAASSDPLAFAMAVYPGFKIGPHHRKLAKLFVDVIEGRIKRLIINIAPRMGKSEFSSYLFPAFFLGKYPGKKIIMGTHTAGLSEDFGRRVRNLIQSEDYAQIFPETVVADDQKAAGKWSTSAGGQYYAAGVGGALAGRGADLFVIDDPHSEQDVKSNSQLAFDTAWSWFQTGPLQRLMPGGAIIVIMTRWGKKDITGKLIEWQTNNPDSVPWEVVELPAILNEGSDAEKSLWPEQWPLDQLKQKKAGMDPQYWNAQYMQNPVSDNAAIVSRKMWKLWPKSEPPAVEYVIQSWDTAYEEKTTADFSACTTWGVFYQENEEGKQAPNVILLDAWKARMGFPELKATALKHYKRWTPDAVIVEKKAAGGPLIQEMRAVGIPVQEFTPSRGNDKIVRLNAIADIFYSGKVWIPDTRWAWEVVEEVASFPNGDHDDYVDTTSQALLRYRQGGFISLDSDEAEGDGGAFVPRRAAYY